MRHPYPWKAHEDAGTAPQHEEAAEALLSLIDSEMRDAKARTLTAIATAHALTAIAQRLGELYYLLEQR